MMKQNKPLIMALGMGVVCSAHAQLLGPSPYLQASDSPFASTVFNDFHLDNFESGALTAPGVTASLGFVFGPSYLGDSVDADDGVIDGHGTNGRSWFANPGATGTEWTFSASVLGYLPTHAGIVWTDGDGLITFEAWDQNGVSLGTITGNHADGSIYGETAEDRFYGVIHAGGISKIALRNTSGGIEMDHLQFGYAPVPEPASLIGLGAGFLLLLRRKRAPKGS